MTHPIDSSPAMARWSAVALLYLGLAGAWLALSQGLSGSFHFDDSWNLRGLEDITRNPTLEQAAIYVSNGISSRLGRPLTLATFALQHHAWPTAPGDFLRLSILLHLLNGALLAWGLLRLLRLMRVPPVLGDCIGVGTAVLWMLAPLQASAVLYIVQRMAVLSATFTFLGFLVYLVGRERLARGMPAAGYLLMTTGVAIGLPLGVLAKENAALFPLLVLATEATLLAELPRERRWRGWAALFLGAPVALLAAYLAWQIPDFLDQTSRRGFTMGERLLTEARILFHYLEKLYLPSPFSIRLLYDDWTISRGLFVPWTTALAVAAWLALLGAALRLRRAAAPFSFAVFWFLGSHILESSFIPLELAFEHRNYTAAAGPLLALVWYAARLFRLPAARRVRPALAVFALAYVGYQVTALAQSSDLWGRPLELARYWAMTQPDSKRAQNGLADTYLLHNLPGQAVEVYERAMARWPTDLVQPLAVIEVGCYFPGGPVPSAEEIQRRARAFDGHVWEAVNMVDRLFTAVEDGFCPRYSPTELVQYLDAVFEAPVIAQLARTNYLTYRARAAELAGDRTTAMHFVEQAIATQPNISLLIQAVYWSLQADQPAMARQYLDQAHQVLTRDPVGRWSYRREMERLEELVRQFEGAALPS